MKQEKKKCCVRQFLRKDHTSESWIQGCKERWEEGLCCHDCPKRTSCPFTCAWSNFPKGMEECNYYLTDFEVTLFKLQGKVVYQPMKDRL